MPINILKATLIAAAITFVFPGCGPTPSGGGETGTGLNDKVTVGVITGFGSVYVNGVEYETNNTLIDIDGVSAEENSLSIGMLVNLKGSVNSDGITGSASSISFEENVEGIVTKNNILTSSQLEVMGQIVIIDNDTIFESKVKSVATFEDIVAEDVTSNTSGNIVEVSGYTSGDGVIYATRVSVEKSTYTLGEPIKVSGLATNVTSTQFQIGKQSFSYSEDSLIDFDGVVFSDGKFVSVKTTGEQDSNSNYIVNQVKYKSSGSSGVKNIVTGEVEFEGYVSQSIDLVLNVFAINGQQIKLDVVKTIFDSGSKELLLKGVKVEVEGVVDTDGNIVAKEIKIRQQSNSKFEGVITSVDKGLKSITVSNQVILVTSTTRVKDERDNTDELTKRYFKFDDLAVGDYIEISAYKNDSDQFVATRLQRDDQKVGEDSFGWELEGKITSLDPLAVDGQIVEFSNGGFTGKLGDKIELNGIFAADGGWLVTESNVKEEWEIEEGVISSINLDDETIFIDQFGEIDVSGIVFNASLSDIVNIKGVTLNGVNYAIEMEVEEEEKEKSDRGEDEELKKGNSDKESETPEEDNGAEEDDNSHDSED